MVAWLARLFGPSTRTRTLDLLEQSLAANRQQQADLREILLSQQDLSARIASEVTTAVKVISDSAATSAGTFRSYLDMISPKGEPQVRQMTDEYEAFLEDELKKGRTEFLKSATPIESPLVDQLSQANEIAADMSAFIRELSQNPPTLS